MRVRVPIVTVLIALFLGAGTALATVVARAVGNRDGADARRPAVGDHRGSGREHLVHGGTGQRSRQGHTRGGDHGVHGRVSPPAVRGASSPLRTATSGLPRAGGDGAIARVTKAGAVTEFPVPTAGDPNDIAVGPDGNLWYVDPAANVIGRIGPRLRSPSSRSASARGAGPTRSSRAPTASSGSPSRRRAVRRDHNGRRDHGVRRRPVRQLRARRHRSEHDGNLWFTMTADPGSISQDHSHGNCLHGVQRQPDRQLETTGHRPPGPDVRALVDRVSGAGPRWAASRPRATSPSTPPGGVESRRTPGSWPPGPTGRHVGSPATTHPGRVARITLPPLVKDMAADLVGTSSARLRGRVRPNSQATAYHFEYSPTPDYGMTDSSALRG